ncbi:MAG TPA: hypothetical protein VFA46_13500 [Actinomycetes bacterium]|nr:hypothetical protein [Actinomycetes bacterium]
MSAPNPSWARAQRLPGLALPDDYKALAETYGVGWFSEWLMADLPDSPYPPFGLLHEEIRTLWDGTAAVETTTRARSCTPFTQNHPG